MRVQDGFSNVLIPSDEQRLRLLAVRSRAPIAVANDAARRQVVEDIAAAIEVKVALIEHVAPGPAALRTESAGTPALGEADAAAWIEMGRLAQNADHAVSCVTWNKAEWTLVRIRRRPSHRLFLLVAGDWTLSARTFVELARTLNTGTSRSSFSSRRVSAAAHRLTRALSTASGVEGVCATALQYAVRTVPSRLAAFAMKTDPGVEALSIVATHGYSDTLVRHVRVRHGEGVFGAVYRDGASLRVANIKEFPEFHPRRRRYRTNSFMAVPVISDGEVIGVISLADRHDGLPYTAEDLTALRTLLAPVGLALAREAARREAQEFARAASLDALSGLFNRRYFHSRLQEELERARRQQSSVALLLIDLDDFKQINDTFGHVAGDDAIRLVADILRASVRTFDSCVRYGGEEFAIVMPGSDTENAARTAERVRQRIQDARLSDPSLAAVRLTVSIGVASTSGGTARELIEAADVTLYEAKRTGKNRVCAAAPGGRPGENPPDRGGQIPNSTDF
jgi:diguanylate cyclase (GGDEF)-like protein